MDCGVYQIQHRESGKRYIGSSMRMAARLAHHRWSLKSGRHHSRKLQRAWDKYGEAAFDISIILYCAKEDRLDYEQRLMDGFHAASHQGYNCSPKAGIPSVGKMSAARLARYKAARRSLAKKYEWKGRMLALSEIAEMEDIKLKLLKTRVCEEGWPIERAATEPLQAQSRVFAGFGCQKTARAWGDELGLLHATLLRALARGESVEEIARKQKRITVGEIANLLGTKDFVVESRLKRGWSLSESMTTPLRAPRGAASNATISV